MIWAVLSLVLAVLLVLRTFLRFQRKGTARDAAYNRLVSAGLAALLIVYYLGFPVLNH